MGEDRTRATRPVAPTEPARARLGSAGPGAYFSCMSAAVAAPLPAAVRFRAPLEPGGPSFMPTQIVAVPSEAVAALGGKKVKRVLATLNGHAPERLGLLPQAGGGRYLLLRKELCQQLGLRFGQEIDVTLAPDPEPDRIDLPEELAEALAAWPAAEAAYQPLNNALKRAMARHVAAAKQAETRARRAVELVERLARHGHPFRTGG